MTDHKFTDDEIIKALECCVETEYCATCPATEFCKGMDSLIENALALINRQKAEIERLTAERNEARRDCAVAERNHQLAAAEREANVEGFIETLKTIKAEAIKEFAENVKAIFECDLCFDADVKGYILNEIDDIVKEMTEVDTK